MSVTRKNQFTKIDPRLLWEQHCPGSYCPPGYAETLRETLEAAARVARLMGHPICAMRIRELLP